MKKTNMRRFLAVLMAAAMLLCFAGCGAEESAPATTQAPAATQAAQAAEAPATEAALEDPREVESADYGYTIAFSALNLQNSFFPPFVELLRARCEALGCELIVHDGQSDVNLQVNAIENWIIQDVDAIVISPVDQSAIQPSIDAAIAAGIPVINTDSKCENFTAYIGVNQYDYGYAAGKLAAEWCNENIDASQEVIKFAVFEKLTSTAIVERTEGILAGITENCPRAEIVARQTATTSDQGVAAAEAILQATPDVDAFVGVNDTGILGGYEAVMASGKDTSKMCFVGVDATSEALALIAKDTCFRGTIEMGTKYFAKTSIDLAIMAIQGNPDMPYESGLVMEPVTIDNVSDFM